MPSEAELAFADQVGRHFARYYGVPPMTGRVAGWLLICDPPRQSAGELADALRASRSAIGGAVATLENWGFAQRSRAAGERTDRITAHPDFGMQSLESPAEYAALAALARHGLEALGDAPPVRRARLLEMGAFADFLVAQMPALAAEWRKRRDDLRMSSDPPDRDS